MIETPNEDARKDYIGNAAAHGRMAAVFAQLVVGGESAACTRCSCPSATRTASFTPGVEIEDCGEKLGLNGVDNGRICFDGVRVPRDALLDRYAEVTPDGEYRSRIENPNRRFFTMLGTLIQGRVSVGGASISGDQVGADDRVRHGVAPPPVRAAGLSRGGCPCSTTASTSAACSRRWRRPTPSTSPRRRWSPTSTGSSPRRGRG